MEYITAVLGVLVSTGTLFFFLCRIVNYVVIHPLRNAIVELKNAMAAAIDDLKLLINGVRADVKRQEKSNQETSLIMAAMRQRIRALEARVKVLESKQ